MKAAARGQTRTAFENINRKARESLERVPSQFIPPPSAAQ